MRRKGRTLKDRADSAAALWHNWIAALRTNSLSRLYFPGDIAAHGACELTAEQAHHAVHVLRLKAGDAVTLFDGDGSEYPAVIAEVTKRGMTLNVGEGACVDRESPLDVTLAQGMSSGERMDFTVQKAVELGVARIQPLETGRSVVRLVRERAEKRVAHWQSVAVAACEQCGRNRVPRIEPVAALRDWLAGDNRSAVPQLRLVLAPDQGESLREFPRPAGSIIVLAGPEGGLEPEERRDAERAGFVPVRLGPRVLRTETAAVAALAAMQLMWGDF